jgi:hypothetical protein
MSDLVLVSLINAGSAAVLAFIGVINTMMTRQNSKQIQATKESIVETKHTVAATHASVVATEVSVKTLEKQTNGLQASLLLASGAVEFEKGRQEGLSQK